MTIQRMGHVGAVVDDLEAAVSFFVELGMELDGGTTPHRGRLGRPRLCQAGGRLRVARRW
jgi:catechol 2,3-dioxygenase-like lactoylglutathione lyase family enzyme